MPQLLHCRRIWIRLNARCSRIPGFPVNVSRNGQRVLHVLAQGGIIRHYKDEGGRISDIECLTREGWLLTLCTLDLFKALRQKGLIASSNGGPYRITRQGLQAVRSRPDNR